jgi:hypothetical protein
MESGTALPSFIRFDKTLRMYTIKEDANMTSGIKKLSLEAKVGEKVTSRYVWELEITIKPPQQMANVNPEEVLSMANMRLNPVKLNATVGNISRFEPIEMKVLDLFFSR